MSHVTRPRAPVPPPAATPASAPPRAKHLRPRAPTPAAAPPPPAAPLGASRPAPTKQRVVAALRREALRYSSPDLAFAALVLEDDAGATSEDIKISHGIAIEPLASALAFEAQALLEAPGGAPRSLVFCARSLRRQGALLTLVARRLEAVATAMVNKHEVPL